MCRKFYSIFLVCRESKSLGTGNRLGLPVINFVIDLSVAYLIKISVLSVTWVSGTARRLQILRDGFDPRLEPIAFDINIPSGC